MENMEIIKEIANSTTVTDNEYYKGTIFESFVKLSPNTKGKLIEAMVAEIMAKNGHQVFDSTNKQHDLRIRFGTDNHKTKIEVKGSMYNKEGKMSSGPINLAQDFDEVIVVMIYPEEVKAYRINRSILRGMEKNDILKQSKQGVMIGGLSSELFESYDCQRVF